MISRNTSQCARREQASKFMEKWAAFGGQPVYGHSDKTNSLTRKGMNIMDLKDLWSDNGHKRLLFAATLAGILCVLGVAVLVFHNFLKAIS